PGQQHHAVKPEIRNLRNEPLVSLFPEGGRHHLDGLLSDLPADVRLSLAEETGHVRARRRRDLTRFEHAFEHFEERGSGTAGIRGKSAGLGEAGEKAGARPGMAGNSLLVDLKEQRVPIAVGVDAVDVLGVPRRLALPPERLARARPEVALTRRTGRV